VPSHSHTHTSTVPYHSHTHTSTAITAGGGVEAARPVEFGAEHAKGMVALVELQAKLSASQERAGSICSPKAVGECQQVHPNATNGRPRSPESCGLALQEGQTFSRLLRVRVQLTSKDVEWDVGSGAKHSRSISRKEKKGHVVKLKIWSSSPTKSGNVGLILF
jgi:hypothetical protein